MASTASDHPSTAVVEQQSQAGYLEGVHAAFEPVQASDADYLAGAVEFAACKSSPLFQVMFPGAGDFSGHQKDEIIRWYAQGIEDAINDGRTLLCKMRHLDGTVAGLAGWVVERDRTTEKTTAVTAGDEKRPENWLPRTLDMSSWIEVSAELRRERERVIGHLDNVCRMP